MTVNNQTGRPETGGSAWRGVISPGGVDVQPTMTPSAASWVGRQVGRPAGGCRQAGGRMGPQRWAPSRGRRSLPGSIPRQPSPRTPPLISRLRRSLGALSGAEAHRPCIGRLRRLAVRVARVKKDDTPQAGGVGGVAWGVSKGAGDDLLSHTVSRAVPSALEGLTTEFGMGSGRAPPLGSPA